MKNEIIKFIKDVTTNKNGDYSTSKIGSIICLTFFIVKMSFCNFEYFATYQIEFAVVCISLTGGRKILDGYSQKLKGVEKLN